MSNTEIVGNSKGHISLIVFLLVSTAFSVVYLTQPVLPAIQREFSSDIATASLTISALIMGIALTNLPFGIAVDRWQFRWVALLGGAFLSSSCVFCYFAPSLNWLIFGRFVQGLAIPSLTTCVAAYLSKILPVSQLKVAMGAYVSATISGGLFGRILAGWIHGEEQWRMAFITLAIALAIVMSLAVWLLPPDDPSINARQHSGYKEIIQTSPALSLFLTGAASFAIFSSLFNFLPFRLEGPEFGLSTNEVTKIYLVYISGIFIGPISGMLANRFSSSAMLYLGSALFAVGLSLTLATALPLIILALVIVCAGFFMLHSSAVGALNASLSSGHGRANALYVLFYYLGGWLGISVMAHVYETRGWRILILSLIALLIVPIITAGNKQLRVKVDTPPPVT